MLPPLSNDVIRGWVSTPNQRGTRDILFSCFATIWLCTWTSLCLNVPAPRSSQKCRLLRYKFRWQLFAIFFPEVLVATAAEQWQSARQSVGAFTRLGYPEWTIQHGFYADMGGILIAPRDCPPFPVDGQQLAYLVERRFLPMPEIHLDEIRAVNKADGLARFITLVQMTWFCIACIGRGANGLAFSTLEVTTLAFIYCTLHTFFFWYHKPLDPETQKTLPVNAELRDLCQRSEATTPGALESYTFTPLDFLKPPPDPKSLTTPFWVGLFVVFGYREAPTEKPAQTLPTHRVIPQDGVSMSLTIYLLFLQVVYYGIQIGFAWVAGFPSQVEWFLWTVSNGTDAGLILLYLAAIPFGTYNAPWLGRWLFDMEATSILQLAAALPHWASLLLHGPFVLLYIGGRALVLVESIISLRALPKGVYQDVNWAAFLPHL
jgi:hypothetical protein